MFKLHKPKIQRRNIFNFLYKALFSERIINCASFCFDASNLRKPLKVIKTNLNSEKGRIAFKRRKWIVGREKMEESRTKNCCNKSNDMPADSDFSRDERTTKFNS